MRRTILSIITITFSLIVAFAAPADQLHEPPQAVVAAMEASVHELAASAISMAAAYRAKTAAGDVLTAAKKTVVRASLEEQKAKAAARIASEETALFRLNALLETQDALQAANRELAEAQAEVTKSETAAEEAQTAYEAAKAGVAAASWEQTRDRVAPLIERIESDSKTLTEQEAKLGEAEAVNTELGIVAANVCNDKKAERDGLICDRYEGALTAQEAVEAAQATVGAYLPSSFFSD